MPRLIQKPITVNHADALFQKSFRGVAAVAGDTIYYHFASISSALLGALADIEGQCSRSICATVGSTDVNWLISEISSKCGSDKVPIRREAFQMLSGLL
jgi:hypothetical protein